MEYATGNSMKVMAGKCAGRAFICTFVHVAIAKNRGFDGRRVALRGLHPMRPRPAETSSIVLGLLDQSIPTD